MRTLKIFYAFLTFSIIIGISTPSKANSSLDLHQSTLSQTSIAQIGGNDSGPAQQSGDSGETQTPSASDSPDAFPILKCNGTGTGGDRADLRGIRFTVSQEFTSVEVRMSSSAAGSYSFTAELRRSTGFTGAASYSKAVTANIPGTSQVTPYLPVNINFGSVPVAGNETFTLRFVSVSGPGTLFFETFGIGNMPCANVDETDENNVATPTVRGDPAGFKVLAASPASLTLASPFVTTPPQIDGSIGFGEWQLGNNIPFENGFISVVNDSIRLYVLIDLLDDTGDDTRDPDYFWLSFDVNKDGAINPNVDINYGTDPSTGNMRFQYYLGPGSWTGLQAQTYSSKARGFGCFFADGTLSILGFPFVFSCSRHRVWELGIDLSEIGTQAGSNARMGFRVSSPTPSFTDNVPANFSTDFTNLIQVSLGAPPTALPPSNPAATISLDTNAIEVTQAIQNRQNTLPLVQDKTTVGRVYAKVNGVASSQPSAVYLYGSKAGVDLPGSPLAMLYMAPTAYNRNTLNGTANFTLPSTWDEGTVSFSSRARTFTGNQASSTPFQLTFTPKEVPTYWIVPINTGTNASPVLVSNAEISSQESYSKAIYPVKGINFVRKNWQVIGPTTVANTINALNQYYNNVVLAWVITVLFTGKAPFVLPDQIYGFTPSGGGISDPTWLGLNGYVARGFRGTSREGTMAHEINHNLDRSTTGTWGRHVPFGCGATGADSAWPYINDDIQQVGFDTRLPWVNGSGGQDTVIPGTFPDMMSYCQSGRLPTKWISDYRWQNLFGNFSTTAAALMLQKQNSIQDVYYITGQVHKNGTGSLNPVLVQPGIPSDTIPPGEYALEIQDGVGNPLYTQTFLVSFVDAEGDPIDTVSFNFQIPVQEGGEKILLKHGDSVLAEITQSPNAPTVSLVSPNGGESWSGEQTITWEAGDIDGDDLSFSILYTPDNGLNWFPVAAGVVGNSLAVNTANLPGGDQAKMRIIATDGFNNTQDESNGTFFLAGNPPEVVINLPLPDAIAAPDSSIVFEGEATDLEDSSIPDESFVWTEGSDVLGVGRQINAVLPAGPHEITLTVMDSDENMGVATVVILVGSKSYLPFANRN